MLPTDVARRSAGRIAGSLLSDVLWGQFCLVLFVRIQDDLFDGQADDRRLLYAADQFLIDGERAFERHFARSSHFWTSYHEALETTTRAILHVDQLQREAAGDASELLAAYVKIDSIFKLGIAAICLKLRQPRAFSALSRFTDEMAMSGQIIDDLEDVEEDLARSRFNYVAKRLLGGRPVAAEQAACHIARELILGDGASRIFAEVRRHLEWASEAARSIDCPPARAQIDQSFRALARLQRHFHRSGVEAAFHSLLFPHSPQVKACDES